MVIGNRHERITFGHNGLLGRLGFSLFHFGFLFGCDGGLAEIPYVKRFKAFEKGIQLGNDHAFERNVPFFVQHERAEALVCDGFVVLKGGEQFVNPSRDLLVGLGKQTLFVAADLVGQRKIVFLAVIRREDHLVERRAHDVAVDFGMTHLDSERTEALNEHAVLVLKCFKNKGYHDSQFQFIIRY